MNDEVRSILLAGVGGQGILRASDILCLAFMESGLDVKKSEVHGMAQRGGSVNTHVRWNAGQVHSPLIGEGEADILLAFEEAEALRYARYLRQGGVVVVNRQAIKPITVTSGGAHYPSEEELRAVYERITDRFYVVPGAELAEKLGNARAANVVLLGVLSSFFDLPAETWLSVIEKRVPPRYVELNRQAFFAGREVLGNTQN